MEVVSRARIYADVNRMKPREYWDYNNYNIEWDEEARFKLVEIVGNGAFSTVFGAIDTLKRTGVVAKMLKTVDQTKVLREIKILKNLYGGINIIKLEAVVHNPVTNMPTLMFEPLLRALDYCHSMGIMHRDLKPNNIMIDHQHKKIRLIDFGLAEFYHVGQNYICKTGTMYYLAPESLLDFEMYDYSVDMWSFGCIAAMMVFRTNHFFAGANFQDQLLCIIRALGTEKLITYCNKFNIPLNQNLVNEMHPHRPWENYINDDNVDLVCPETFNFIDKLLQYDHSDRMTADEAMKHAFFEGHVSAE